MSRHWGEIQKTETNEAINVNADIEKALHHFNLGEYTSEEDNTNDTLDTVLPSADPLVLYAISLHKYMNEMTEIIRLTELAVETNVIPSEDAAPKIPEMPDVKLLHKQNCFNYIPREETDFTRGIAHNIPNLGESVCKKLLNNSIAALFAQIGYETTHQSNLDILVDVVIDFYKLFCSKLKIAIDDEEFHQSSGFPNPIERVLTDIGMEGISGLHDYYQTRVIRYVTILQKRCKNLSNYYEKLMKSRNDMDLDIKSVEVKVEKEEPEENKEIHLLDGDDSFPLETGYQLLSSLEAETG